MKKTPSSEGLVDRAWEQHGVALMKPIDLKGGSSVDGTARLACFRIEIEQCSPFDQVGVDRFLVIKNVHKRRRKDGSFEQMERWVWMPMQVKTSDSGEALGVYLPLPDPLPKKLKDRLTRDMFRKIRDHSRKHPAVSCMLFVPPPTTNAQEDAKIMKGIWRETLKLVSLWKIRNFHPEQ